MNCPAACRKRRADSSGSLCGLEKKIPHCCSRRCLCEALLRGSRCPRRIVTSRMRLCDSRSAWTCWPKILFGFSFKKVSSSSFESEEKRCQKNKRKVPVRAAVGKKVRSKQTGEQLAVFSARGAEHQRVQKAPCLIFTAKQKIGAAKRSKQSARVRNATALRVQSNPGSCKIRSAPPRSASSAMSCWSRIAVRRWTKSPLIITTR